MYSGVAQVDLELWLGLVKGKMLLRKSAMLKPEPSTLLKGLLPTTPSILPIILLSPGSTGYLQVTDNVLVQSLHD